MLKNKEGSRREGGGPFRGMPFWKGKEGDRGAFKRKKCETPPFFPRPGLARCSSSGWVTALLGRSQLTDRDTITQEEVSGMEFGFS